MCILYIVECFHIRSEYCDVVIEAEDGVEFSCHKCILVSRLGIAVLASSFATSALCITALCLNVLVPCFAHTITLYISIEV